MGKRILGVDPGSVRIGLSLADKADGIAFPAGTIQRGEGNVVERVLDLLQAEDAEELVVGLPLNLDGTEGPPARRARKFGEGLTLAAAERGLALRIEYLDERFTSRQAGRALSEAGVKKKKQRGKVDSVAATLLLQAYLDSRQTHG